MHVFLKDREWNSQNTRKRIGDMKDKMCVLTILSLYSLKMYTFFSNLINTSLILLSRIFYIVIIFSKIRVILIRKLYITRISVGDPTLFFISWLSASATSKKGLAPVPGSPPLRAVIKVFYQLWQWLSLKWELFS